jgi:nuclease S1
MGRFARFTLLLLCVVSFQRVGFGWGCSGHQIVALVAERQLNDKAAAQVQALLNGSTLTLSTCKTTLSLIAKYASWADDFKKTTAGKPTSPWHFLDIPLTATAQPAQGDFCDQGCVTKAIEDSRKTLKSKTASKAAKTKALAMLIHFVGDEHQPLHAATNDDRGGNCLPVTYFGKKAKLSTSGSYSPELHGIWDTDMPEKIAKIRKATHDDDVTQFVDSLMSDFEEKMTTWLSEPVDVQAWAWESHQLAATQSYGKLPVHVDPLEPVPVNQCTDDDNIGQKLFNKHEKISQKYVSAVDDTIKEQLAKGGTRLAAVLNDIWQ